MISPIDFSDFMGREFVRVSKRYFLYGDPVPLARPRFVIDEGMGKTRVYDSQKSIKRDLIRDLKKQHGALDLFEGPLHVDFRFYMEPSAKHHGYHASRPDLSNLVKMYEDIGSGILYHDDAQISSFTATKEYATGEKRTEITIYQLESNGKTKTKDVTKQLSESKPKVPKKKGIRF